VGRSLEGIRVVDDQVELDALVVEALATQVYEVAALAPM
jgi:hypothetical protein